MAMPPTPGTGHNFTRRQIPQPEETGHFTPDDSPLHETQTITLRESAYYVLQARMLVCLHGAPKNIMCVVTVYKLMAYAGIIWYVHVHQWRLLRIASLYLLDHLRNSAVKKTCSTMVYDKFCNFFLLFYQIVSKYQNKQRYLVFYLNTIL